VELVEFLLAHGDRSRALSELLLLSANSSETVENHNQIGQMFLEAGEARRALDQFTRALHVDRRNPDALAGAGEAAFNLGDYPLAQRYLAEAPPDRQRVQQLKTVVALVLSNDPLARGLSERTRTHRFADAIRQASQTLDACLTRSARDDKTDPALERLRPELQTLESDAGRSSARISRDVVESGLDLIYQIEQGVDRTCGIPSAADQALLLIGRRHQGS
jgi:tetratricopeptide (TPR) repeat protein